MYNKLEISILAILLIQIYISSGTASAPVIHYSLYGGNKANAANSSQVLTGADSYTSNFESRFGNNDGITLASDSTPIRFDQSPINAIGTGDFTILSWANLEKDETYTTIFSLVEGTTVKLDFRISKSSDYIYIAIQPSNQITISSHRFTNWGVWTQLGIEYNSSTNRVQVYIDGQTFATPKPATFDLSTFDDLGYIGSYKGMQITKGSIAEFKVYDTLFYPEYYEAFIPPLNKLVDLGINCPSNTSQWNLGSDTTKRVCIHDTCVSALPDLISYLQSNLTITTNTAGLSWEDQVDLEYTVSKPDCGSGNDEECFIDTCFQHAVLQAEDTDYNVTAVPGTVELVNPSEAGFTFLEYHNSTNCDITTNSSTCYFVMPFVFAGTVSESTFARDRAFIDYKFTVVYSKVPGEDTIVASLTDQSFGTATHQTADDVEANIENGAQALAGATLDFDGSAPASIAIGDDIDLEFAAPDGHLERDFKNGTFEVELVFSSNGTEVIIPVTPSNTTFVNEGSATPGDNRSVQFSIQANYLGTYTVRASATLESSARRILLESTENSNLNSELQINVVQRKVEQFNYLYVFVPVVFIIFAFQQYRLTKQKPSMQKNTKYEQVEIQNKA